MDEQQWRADGRPMALGSRAMEVLFELVERSGRLVSWGERIARDGIVRTHGEVAAVEQTLRILSNHLDSGTQDHLPARGEPLLEQDFGAGGFGHPGRPVAAVARVAPDPAM